MSGDCRAPSNWVKSAWTSGGRTDILTVGSGEEVELSYSSWVLSCLSSCVAQRGCCGDAGEAQSAPKVMVVTRAAREGWAANM